MTKQHRLFTEWFGRRLDLGAWLIGPLFVLMWFFLPAAPAPAEGQQNPERRLFVQAWHVPLRQVPVYIRPSLVTLPSRYSFVPKQDPSSGSAQIPAFAYATAMGELSGFPRQRGGADPWPNGILAERQMPLMMPPRAARPTTGSAAAAGAASPWLIHLSQGLAGSRMNRDADRFALLSQWDQAWESEVWISFDRNGWPQDVFVEQSSGTVELDRMLVRILGSVDLWERGAGMGLIVVRHDPNTGAVHANTDS